MTTNRFLPLLGLCTTLALAALPARADLIIGNLDGTTPPSPSEGGLLASGPISDPLGAGLPYGFGFTMPGATAYTLDDVLLTLTVAAPASPTSGDLGTISIAAALYGDAGGSPGGSPLVSFSPPTIPSTAGVADYTLTPTAPFVLQPGTTYWFAVTGSVAGQLAEGALYWDNRNTVVPTGLATSAGYVVNTPPWGVWTPSVPGFPGQQTPQPTLAINGTPVPVPAPLALMLAGLAGIGVVRVRRR